MWQFCFPVTIREGGSGIITNLGNGGTAGGTLYKIIFSNGLIAYTGLTAAGTGNRTVTFPAAFSTLISALIFPEGSVISTTNAVTSTTSGLTISSTNSQQFNWLALGI